MMTTKERAQDSFSCCRATTRVHYSAGFGPRRLPPWMISLRCACFSVLAQNSRFSQATNVSHVIVVSVADSSNKLLSLHLQYCTNSAFTFFWCTPLNGGYPNTETKNQSTATLTSTTLSSSVGITFATGITSSIWIQVRCWSHHIHKNIFPTIIWGL